MSKLAIFLLGPPRIELDGTPIDVDRRKAIALVAYLAVTDQAHTRDALATLLWPEFDQSRARAALRRTLSVLNKALNNQWLEIDRESVGLAENDKLRVDVRRFRQQLSSPAEPNQLANLTEAVSIYQGDFMAGFTLRDSPAFDEWQFFQAETLRQDMAGALERLVAEHTAQSNDQPAITYARQWLALDPLQEPAHRHLMQLYATTGQRPAALRQYQECVRILEQELGAAPSAETTALYERIHSGEWSRGPEEQKSKEEFITPPTFLSHAPLPLTPATPFVAREAELAQLNRYLNSALTGQSQIIFVTGEAGSGKTALVNHFARQAQQQLTDLVVAGGTCNAHTGSGDPYLPFREILSRLDVEWQWTASTHVTQSDLFEQFTQTLQTISRQQPLLLIIDDTQWADAASISLLFHLSRRMAGCKVMIVVTYRPHDVALGRYLTHNGDQSQRHPLEAIVNEIKRAYGDIQLDLDRATDWEFIEALLDVEPNRLGPGFRHALFQRTQGHPLFTVELLRTMQQRGDIIQNEQGYWIEGGRLNWHTLPARVEAVIEERVSRLAEEARHSLTVASVEGETFTAQVVAQVQGVDERHLLRNLSQELDRRHHLVREQGEIQTNGHFMSRYQFVHNLFQQYLYNSLSAAERRLLHGDIALALEHFYARHTEDVIVQLAHHYTEAGQVEQAVTYLLKAGDQARSLYANEEAIEFYQKALTFLKAQQDYDQAARTLMKLGLTHHLAFNFPQARQAYQEGFTLWQQAGLNRPVPPLPAPQALKLAWIEPPTVDPSLASDDSAGNIIRQLFSGLVTLNPELDVVPELAQSWEMLEGGSKYIFHLQNNARWSDGVPVTAHDFVYAWKRTLNPATKSVAANFLYDIKGAEAFNRGQTPDDRVGVQALDNFTLLVELEAPAGYFPQLLTQPNLCPIPRHTVEIYGNSWTDPDHIVTNGPFKLEQWQPGKLIVLTRNPAYRGRWSGNVERVELVLNVPSVAEQIALYDKNQLDIARLFAEPETPDVRHQRATEYVSGPLLNVHYIGFNIRQPPFDDPRVRQALALACDKETLASVTLSGYAFPGNGGFVPPDMPGHSPGIGLPYDPQQAQQLLAEAGYPEGRNFPVVEGAGKLHHEASCNYLSEQWQSILGVKVVWHALTWSQLLDKLEQNPPHLFRMGWMADYPDPDNVLRMGSNLSYHWGGWQDKTYLDLVEQARRITNQAERMKLYYEADKILIEAAAIIPLTYGRRHRLVKPWVSKFPTGPTSWSFWKDVVIDPHQITHL